jgi:hypothetical protein
MKQQCLDYVPTCVLAMEMLVDFMARRANNMVLITKQRVINFSQVEFRQEFKTLSP